MQKYFFIKLNGKHVKINFFEILYAEGCRNYIKIITESKAYLVLITMKRLEQILPAGMFTRIHKSFIVSLEKIIEFDPERVYIKGKELPIGQQYKGELEKAVLIASEATNELTVASHFYPIPVVIKANQRNRLFEAG